MGIGENPKKIDNIVEANLDIFRSIYLPLLEIPPPYPAPIGSYHKQPHDKIRFTKNPLSNFLVDYFWNPKGSLQVILEISRKNRFQINYFFFVPSSLSPTTPMPEAYFSILCHPLWLICLPPEIMKFLNSIHPFCEII
jgi:hypothetical protein